MYKHLNIVISGKVQGVFYRTATKNKARDLDLVGFVHNEPDDSVSIEVEGEEEKLDQFLDFCKSGPDHAQVSNIDVQEKELKNFKEFKIKY
ncbi:acylphosphatase [Patescibacteria group bacterium]